MDVLCRLFHCKSEWICSRWGLFWRIIIFCVLAKTCFFFFCKSTKATWRQKERKNQRRMYTVLWCLDTFPRMFLKSAVSHELLAFICLKFKSKTNHATHSPWAYSWHPIPTLMSCDLKFFVECFDSVLALTALTLTLVFCVFVLSDRRTTSWRNTGKGASEALWPTASLPFVWFACTSLPCHPWVPNTLSERAPAFRRTSHISLSVATSDQRSSWKRFNQLIPPVWKRVISWFQRAPSRWLDLSPFHGWNLLPCMERESCQ